ncbi:hypothetical protein KM043_015411 [Ampulex compressa]|nr:hypothetical protein KM043_015411 [Ampulex compressa]
MPRRDYRPNALARRSPLEGLARLRGYNNKEPQDPGWLVPYSHVQARSASSRALARPWDSRNLGPRYPRDQQDPGIETAVTPRKPNAHPPCGWPVTPLTFAG